MDKSKIAGIVVAMALTLGVVACGGPSRVDRAIDQTGQPAISATAAPAKPTTKAAKPISAEQRNAIRSAEDYLNGQSFSRKGLIGQLQYEGYSAANATAAVDSLRIDWNAQAVLVAQNYLDGQAFSRKGLIAQLEYEGFSHAQAVHGVDGAGLCATATLRLKGC